MQDNLGSSDIHGDNLIVVENNAKLSTMPSAINPYHENERENESAKVVAVKSKQNANATTDKEISAIQFDCESAVVSNLICDISNVQLNDQIVSEAIDDYQNTAIIAPSPTQKSNSRSTNASKRCKKCNCVCDRSATDDLPPNALETNAGRQRDGTDSCANANDAVHTEEPTTA